MAEHAEKNNHEIESTKATVIDYHSHYIKGAIWKHDISDPTMI